MQSIKQEIKQRRPFTSPAEETFVALQRTADLLLQGLSDILRPQDLTFSQYNILRILRGAGGAGATVGEVGERMVTRDPDVTRLLDRMERRGLVIRARETSDRRVVRAWLTAEGLEMVSQLDSPVQGFHASCMRMVDAPTLAQLNDTLSQIREATSLTLEMTIASMKE